MQSAKKRRVYPTETEPSTECNEIERQCDINILDLPMVLLRNSLSFASLQQLILCQLVCKTFESAAKHPSCITKIEFVDWEKDEPHHDFFAKLFEKYSENPENFYHRFNNVTFLQCDMNQIDGDKDEENINKYTKTIIPYLKKLEYIHFYDWNNAIKGYEPPFHIGIMRELTVNTARDTLKQINFGDCSVNFELCLLIEKLSNLRTIEFAADYYSFCYQDFNVEFIEANQDRIKRCFSHITHLEIGAHGNRNDIHGPYGAFFECIIHPNIEFLHIQSNPDDLNETQYESRANLINCDSLSKLKKIEFSFDGTINNCYLDWTFSIFDVVKHTNIEILDLHLDFNTNQHCFFNKMHWAKFFRSNGHSVKQINIFGYFKSITSCLIAFTSFLPDHNDKYYMLFRKTKFELNIKANMAFGFCDDGNWNQRMNNLALCKAFIDVMKEVNIKCKIMLDFCWEWKRERTFFQETVSYLIEMCSEIKIINNDRHKTIQIE